MDTKAIIQALITAAVTGLIVMYGSQQSLMVEIGAIRDDVAEVKRDLSDIRKDIYIPIR